DSFLDHRPLEFGEYAHHLEHGFACRRGGVEPLLMQVEIDPQGVNFRQEADEVLKAAAEPINRPGHDHVEVAFGGIPAERIEAGALVTSSGATDAVILVDLDDLTAHAAGDLAQLALLIGGGLVEGADAKVENSALHRKILSV